MGSCQLTGLAKADAMLMLSIGYQLPLLDRP
jgi:hypothetical protein